MMTEHELFQEVNSSVHGKRFYAPELGKSFHHLTFNNIESLILLSLSNTVPDNSLFEGEETFELRKAIEHGKIGTAKMELSKAKIRQIEKFLPVFGTVDESVYGPLRVKLSSAILNMDTVTLEEVNKNDVTDKSSDDTENNA